VQEAWASMGASPCAGERKKDQSPKDGGERAFEQGCEYARTFFSFDQQLVLPHAKIA